MSRIKHIGDIEHIRKYPSMYIGSTENHFNLIREVIDNSIDEIINGYANELYVDIDDNGYFRVADNGRGIPIHKITIDSKEEDSVVAACTRLHTGGKFDRTDYKFTIGMHGIGLVAVNALSKKMVVTVMKKDKIYDYYFENSKLDNKTIYKNDYGITGTIVECLVDDSFFNSTEIDKDRIIRILKLVSSRFKAKVFFNNEEIKSISEDEYVKDVLSIDSIDGKIDFSDDDIRLRIYISCSRSEGKVIGDVNLHICDGTYISNVINSIVSILKSLGFESINKSDIENNFKIYVSMYSSNATFDSQYKLKCTTNISKNLDNDLFKKSIRKLLNDEKFLSLVKEIIESKSKNKIKSRKRVRNDNPLIDCIKHPGDILYIVEGESACGTLREVINNKTEAIFPITGKILQTSEMEFDRVLKSKKMEYLFEAIGGGKRYRNYKILTDADSDGGHIAVLLIVAIYKFARSIIDEGRLYLIVPPLYGKVVKGKFIPIYHIDGESKSNLIRFKGIGEMNPEELEVIIRGGYEYKIQPGKENLLRILSDTGLKRKVSENLDFNKEKLVNKVLAIINDERRNDYGRESVPEKETYRRKTNN